MAGNDSQQQSRPRGRAFAAQVAAPLRSFLATESGSAGLLLASAALALLAANVGLADTYESLWGTELAVTIGDEALAMDLRHWVNDGLMALFFFVIGLEVRREFDVGELTDRRRIALPVVAAVGGLVVPAAIYLAFNSSGGAANGWGIVIGTDTAFLLGALALVGPAFPTQLRVFLLLLTIVDDIVAVTVIGVVYSGSIDLVAIAVAAAALASFQLLERVHEWRMPAYALVGLVLWVATVESGLHPTIAGMLAGLLIAAREPRADEVARAASLFRAFRQAPRPEVGRSAIRGLERAVSVNERLQERLHPVVSYVIVPIFAFANSGLDLGGGLLSDALTSPVTWGIVAGLVLGKFVGIGFGAVVARRFDIGEMPRGVSMGQVFGGGALSGIGFTVSLLIAQLAFDDPGLRDEATLGVFAAAILSIGTGWLVFRLAERFGSEATGEALTLDEPVDPARDHLRGPGDAPLTLIEYGDYECPFCGRATGVLRDLHREFGDRLRYGFRHLPLPEVHPHAELAAHGAEAAAAQGKFWEMHDILYAHQGALEVEDLLGYAADLELDVERFARDLSDPEIADRVEKDAASADASGAQGTPTFFINGRRHLGPTNTDSLSEALREAEREVSAREPDRAAT